MKYMLINMTNKFKDIFKKLNEKLEIKTTQL